MAGSTAATKKSFPCSYFARDGFCVKGDLCEFNHDKQHPKRTPCKNMLTHGECKYGANCLFSHAISVLSRGRSVKKAENGNTKDRVVEEASQSKVASTTSLSYATGNQTASVEALWGFEDEGGNDPGYFYGAAGSSFQHPHPRRYSQVVGRGGDESASSSSSTFSSRDVQRKTVCLFFMTGQCKYGAGCRNIHPSPEPSTNEEEEEALRLLSLSAEALEETPSLECGICMAARPENGLYGVLSGCSCVFCLDCIRNWRKEGLSFEDASQVRLCPLCRVTSHFIISSRNQPRDAKQKEDLVSAYRTSLASIPCQV